MKCFYCDDFVLPLPPEHRFPMVKYSRLRQRLLEQNIIPAGSMFVPDAATDEEILRCHDVEYLDKVKAGTLSQQEIRRIGFPWSPQLVERSRRSSGATIAASRAALLGDGIAANLAGGTHHACRDHGEGFCVFNDVAIAARTMQAERLAERVVIIDCDVHQGNGTADITCGDSTIFTFSIHGEKNFPFRKIASDLDISLPDHTTDDVYLELVEEGTRRAISASNADFALYVSGADPYSEDRLGKLSITKEGLKTRDQLVIDLCTQNGLPLAIVMGGGYANNISDIVEIHANTIQTAAEKLNV